MRYPAASLVMALVLSLAALRRSDAQETIYTPCGDTIRVVERYCQDKDGYDRLLFSYEKARDGLVSGCASYVEEKAAYDRAVAKQARVSDGVAYPGAPQKGRPKPLRRYAGSGLGSVGFDFGDYGLGEGMDTLEAPGSGRGIVLTDAAGRRVRRDPRADALDRSIKEAFVELEEFYGVTPKALVFMGEQATGSPYRWYVPVFGEPAEPDPPDTLFKPVFPGYYSMYYHPRPLGPCDRSENPVIGSFSFSMDDFFGNGSGYEVTLREYWDFPDDLRQRIPGNKCWDERAAMEFGPRGGSF